MQNFIGSVRIPTVKASLEYRNIEPQSQPPLGTNDLRSRLYRPSSWAKVDSEQSSSWAKVDSEQKSWLCRPSSQANVMPLTLTPHSTTLTPHSAKFSSWSHELLEPASRSSESGASLVLYYYYYYILVTNSWSLPLEALRAAQVWYYIITITIF